MGAGTNILHCTCKAQHDIGLVEIETKPDDKAPIRSVDRTGHVEILVITVHEGRRGYMNVSSYLPRSPISVVITDFFHPTRHEYLLRETRRADSSPIRPAAQLPPLGEELGIRLRHCRPFTCRSAGVVKPGIEDVQPGETWSIEEVTLLILSGQESLRVPPEER